MNELTSNQPQEIPDQTEVAVVGAGPIGIELAVALRQRRIPYEVFEAGSLGNTIAWWAPQTRWFSSNERIAIAGVPLLTPDQSKATREQYLMYLRSVVTQFGIRIHTQSPVVNIDRESTGFRVTLKSAAGQRTCNARTVVLAVGGTDFPKRLGIPGEDLPHVDGYLRETHQYFGRRVVIIGGRNSAIEAALRLHHAGAHVALSYRGETLPEDGIKYWLLPEIKGLLRVGRIADYCGTTPVEINPRTIRLRSNAEGKEVDVPADDVLSLIGYEQEKSLLTLAGIDLVDAPRRPAYDPETMETNVKGIYVAGTATAGTQSSKYKTFLENCHDHVDRILQHLTGKAIESEPREYSSQIVAEPES